MKLVTPETRRIERNSIQKATLSRRDHASSPYTRLMLFYRDCRRRRATGASPPYGWQLPKNEAERICDEEAEIIEVHNQTVTRSLKQYHSLSISLMQFMQEYWCPQMQEYLRGVVNLDEGCSTQLNDIGIILTRSTRLHSNALCVHLHPKVTEGNEGSSWNLLG
jgi:hypothetical protein